MKDIIEKLAGTTAHFTYQDQKHQGFVKNENIKITEDDQEIGRYTVRVTFKSIVIDGHLQNVQISTSVNPTEDNFLGEEIDAIVKVTGHQRPKSALVTFQK